MSENVLNICEIFVKNLVLLVDKFLTTLRKSSFHIKHKNNDGNHSMLGPGSQFSFFRSLARIPFAESIDCLHCMMDAEVW